MVQLEGWKEANLQKKENCQRKNAHKVKKECTIHHHLPTHAEKAMLLKQKHAKKNFASLWWFSAYATRCSAIITGIEDNKEPLESRVRKQQKTSKDEDLDCWTILSESTLLVSASFGDWTICSGWFRCCFDGRKHRPPTLGHFLQMSWRLLMASSTPTAFRHEWISLVLSTKKRLGSKKY